MVLYIGGWKNVCPLTDISRQYCKDEFVKGTDEFLECINAFNREQAAIPKTQRQHFQLATLDVVAFSKDTITGIKVKEALINFSKFLIEKSSVKYNDKCYQPLVGYGYTNWWLQLSSNC